MSDLDLTPQGPGKVVSHATECETCGGRGWLSWENSNIVYRCGHCTRFNSDCAARRHVAHLAGTKPGLMKTGKDAAQALRELSTWVDWEKHGAAMRDSTEAIFRRLETALAEGGAG